MNELRIGVERLVNNTVVSHKLTRDRAIFLLETILQDLKRKPPVPPEPPVVRKAA